MPNQETMRGLERGLRVLEALESKPISSLHDLHLATGISKPVLLRMLQAVIPAAGFVQSAHEYPRTPWWLSMKRSRQRMLPSLTPPRSSSGSGTSKSLRPL